MKEKEIILPDDWEVKEVKGNKIIIQEAKKNGLPKTYEDCLWQNDIIPVRIPCWAEKSMGALGKLLLCRDAWLKSLVWTPNWEKPDEKHCIVYAGNLIEKQVKSYESCILAFPTYELRNQFLKTFRDLIEEAKELL